EINSLDGFTVTSHGGFKAPPKPFAGDNRQLYERVKESATDLGLSNEQASSGGITDGNHLWDAGLPNTDTMGPVGGKIHTDEEYLLADTLTQRAKLTAHVLFRYADNFSDGSFLVQDAV
ncbi:MAG: M20/M25/M40 family metallo-hydrolase, partial [bacterium]